MPLPSHTPGEPETALSVLRRLIDLPGTIAGTSLITGDRYERLTPWDHAEFLRAHVLGPGKLRRPPSFIVRDRVETRPVASFVRSELLPVSEDQRCTHVSVTCTTRNAMEPGDGLRAAAVMLREAGRSAYIERSVLQGVWNLWLVFDAPATKREALRIADRIRSVLNEVGDRDISYRLPLLDDQGSCRMYLPHPFFAGSFLGILHSLDEYANLIPLSVDPMKSTQPEKPADDFQATGIVNTGSDLDGLLAGWHELFGSRAARSGEIWSRMKDSGLLPSRLSNSTAQASAIQLGRELLAYSRRVDSAFEVSVSRSGNSSRFAITPRGAIRPC